MAAVAGPAHVSGHEHTQGGDQDHSAQDSSGEASRFPDPEDRSQGSETGEEEGGRHGPLRGEEGRSETCCQSHGEAQA